MSTATPNAYLQTRVLTASPADLRLMLLDGAIKFAGQARTGLEQKDYEATYNGISRCQAILMELINALVKFEDRTDAGRGIMREGLAVDSDQVHGI